MENINTLTILLSGQFAVLVTMLTTMAIFIWRTDKRAEERTTRSHNKLAATQVELASQMQTLVTGIAVLATRMESLEEGQTQILTRLGNLETSVGNLETSVAVLETRLETLEEKATDMQGELAEIRKMCHKSNVKVANLDGLVRGYLIGDNPLLAKPAAKPVTPVRG